jgi:hypothetical protein
MDLFSVDSRPIPNRRWAIGAVTRDVDFKNINNMHHYLKQLFISLYEFNGLTPAVSIQIVETINADPFFVYGNVQPTFGQLGDDFRCHSIRILPMFLL